MWLEGINNRTNEAEEQISEMEDRLVENTDKEKMKEKRKTGMRTV